MKALLGRKLGMSQVFSDNGEVVPVTLILAEPNVVTLRRVGDKDGYEAVQLALPRKKGENAEELSTKKGLKPREWQRMYIHRKEFRGVVSEEATVVGVDQFAVGDVIQVSGTSKGKGYAGVVKRHHFKGGPASHGHKHVLRRPGSIGGRFPQHVMKGMRMAGRMGGERVTVKNLVVVAVDAEKNVLAVKGAVPGTKGSVVEILAAEEVTA